MKEQLFLHIGQPKSGTTSLQSFLAQERDALQEQGFLYPELANVANTIAHHALSYDIRESCEPELRMPQHAVSRDKDIWGHLDALLASSDVSNVVLSSEDFYFMDLNENASQSAIKYLKDLLSSRFRSVKVIIYLRRQDAHMESWCNQLIKHGPPILSTRDIGAMAGTIPTSHCNYHELTRRWVKQFGKDSVDIRTFDRTKLKDGSVLSDFCSVIGYQPSSMLKNFGERNPRLTRLGFEVIRRANRFAHPKPVHGHAVRMLTESGIEADDPPAPTPYLYFPPELVKSWRRSNRRLPLAFEDPLFKKEKGPVRPYCRWTHKDLEPLEEMAAHACFDNDKQKAGAGLLINGALKVMKSEQLMKKE